MRTTSMPGARMCLALLATAGFLASCGLEDGARFGRPGARPGVLRVHVRERPVELDPARARTPLERAIARQLWSALVEPASDPHGSQGRVRPALATSWTHAGAGNGEHGRLILKLRDDARFSDGTPLTAHDVVWSWRRALRSSTGGADPRLSATIANGAALAAGTLLRIVAAEPVRARGPPYGEFVGDGDGARAPTEGVFAPGAAVRVIDTNARVAAGEPVPLFRAPEGGAATSSLARGEVATIIALVEIAATAAQGSAIPAMSAKGDAPRRTMLQVRARDGAAGWASAAELTRHVPAIGVVPVVHRGGAAPVLRTGPDELAPARATLGDESAVEVLERGAPFSLVVDVASGKTGFLDSALLEDTGRERRWFLVEALSGADGRPGDGPTAAGARGWVSERDLAFDPNLLDVVAVDERTLEVGLAVDVDRALEAFAEPAFRPLPARVVEEYGRAWTAPGTIVTSGPFTRAGPADDDAGRDTALVLVRSPTSFEAARAHLARVELVAVERPTTALHLYRTGHLDALLDGALPPELAPALARAADWHPGAEGGALVAPEVTGFSVTALELRDVRVRGGDDDDDGDARADASGPAAPGGAP